MLFLIISCLTPPPSPSQNVSSDYLHQIVSVLTILPCVHATDCSLSSVWSWLMFLNPLLQPPLSMRRTNKLPRSGGREVGMATTTARFEEGTIPPLPYPQQHLKKRPQLTTATTIDQPAAAHYFSCFEMCIDISPGCRGHVTTLERAAIVGLSTISPPPLGS
jgi:hypothetical protein